MTSLSLLDCSIRFEEHVGTVCVLSHSCAQQWNATQSLDVGGIIIHMAIEVEFKYQSAYCHFVKFNYIDASYAQTINASRQKPRA